MRTMIRSLLDKNPEIRRNIDHRPNAEPQILNQVLRGGSSAPAALVLSKAGAIFRALGHMPTWQVAEYRTPNPKTRNQKPETRNLTPKTRNPRPKTRNPKPETRNTRSETRNPKPETRNPKHENRNSKHEI